jgi:hypothetical protein
MNGEERCRATGFIILTGHVACMGRPETHTVQNTRKLEVQRERMTLKCSVRGGGGGGPVYSGSEYGAVSVVHNVPTLT